MPLSSTGSPAVSVYIVNHNYGRFLEQAIHSVLDQDYPALELIVVDDASDDDSDRVLEAFREDSRVRVIRQVTNRGLTACCNAAIRASTGEFVMRLDADDYLLPHAVSSMAAALLGEPAAPLVFPDYLEVDARGTLIRRVKRHDFAALEAISDLPAHGACTMVRRSFLDSFGGYDAEIACQDGFDLWLNVGADQRVINIGEPLFAYRQHGGNLTRNERVLLRARARLLAKHVARRGLTRPRVLAVVPVRGREVDPQSLALEPLGDGLLIDWTVREALVCGGIDRVIVSSPDQRVLEHVDSAYGAKVGAHGRVLELAGLNVGLSDTVRQVLHAELAEGRSYDAALILAIESPFRSSLFMQMSIDIMQLFGVISAIGVRREDDAFYRHDGLGLRPVREDGKLRLEREDLFRACGGMRLIKLGLDAEPLESGRLGHVLLDPISALNIRTSLDWQMAHHLVVDAYREFGLDR